MNKEEFAKLKRGDIVRHINSDLSLIVTGNYGNRITAVRTFDLTQPDEWILVNKFSPWEEEIQT